MCRPLTNARRVELCNKGSAAKCPGIIACIIIASGILHWNIGAFGMSRQYNISAVVNLNMRDIVVPCSAVVGGPYPDPVIVELQDAIVTAACGQVLKIRTPAGIKYREIITEAVG